MPGSFADISLDTAVYNSTTLHVVCTGLQFGENQYPESSITLSDDGGATWTIPTTILTWANDAATGLLAAILPLGTYSVRLVTSDNTPLYLLNHITIGGGANTPSQPLSLSVANSL